MMTKEERDCHNCDRVVTVIKSGKLCPYRPRTNMPVYCDNWEEHDFSKQENSAGQGHSLC